MKKITKIFALVLALCAALSAFAGCKKNKNNGNSGEVTATERVRYTDGIHVRTAVETDKDFIKDGATDYVLVVSESATAKADIAREEFVDLFRTATGITIRIIKDTGLTHNSENKYISLGDTTLFRTSGIEMDKDTLWPDGHIVVTKDNTIFLNGPEDYGIVYSVYTFMEITFNYEFYYHNCIEIDENVRNKKLLDYDVTEVPDLLRNGYWYGQLPYPKFSYRASQYMNWRFRVPDMAYNYCLATYTDKDNYKQGSHGTEMILPRAAYQTEHPGWFSTVGNQWCYTARGDEKEFEEMAQEVAKKIELGLTLNPREEYPLINYTVIGMEDNYEMCACDKCRELEEHYGTESGAIVIFFNRVGEILDEWMAKPENEPYKRDDFHIEFLAYNNGSRAPVKYNESTGKYEAVDEKVICNHNVGVKFADIKMDWQQSIYSDFNSESLKDLLGWGALTDRIDYYCYPMNYNNSFFPFDVFNTFTSDLFQLYKAVGGVRYYMDVPMQHGGLETNWARLKLYLCSKLCWNTALDEKELMDNWFNAMFADAAPVMRSMFDEQRVHMAKICTQYDLYTQDSIYTNFIQSRYFPKNTLYTFMGKADEALKAVAKYESIDKSYYDVLKEHIEAEYIAPAWMLLNLYRTEMLEGEKNDIKNRIMDAANATGAPDMVIYGYGKVFLNDSIAGM